MAIIKTQGIWSILETSNGTVTISGTSVVNGSVGVNSGGKLTMTGSAAVQGQAYLYTGDSKSLGSSTSIQGGLKQDSGANAVITAAVSEAATAYNNFKALTKNLGTCQHQPLRNWNRDLHRRSQPERHGLEFFATE